MVEEQSPWSSAMDGTAGGDYILYGWKMEWEFLHRGVKTHNGNRQFEGDSII